jgi:hypothetical protein
VSASAPATSTSVETFHPSNHHRPLLLAEIDAPVDLGRGAPRWRVRCDTTFPRPRSPFRGSCPVARILPVVAIALPIGYACANEVVSPYGAVWPIEWRTVAELRSLASAFAVLVSAVIAAHCPGWSGDRTGPITFTPR